MSNNNNTTTTVEENTRASQEAVIVQHLIDEVGSTWVDGRAYPRLGDWIDHYAAEHMTREELEIVANHFLLSEVASVAEDAKPSETPLLELAALARRIDRLERRTDVLEVRVTDMETKVAAIERCFERIEKVLTEVEGIMGAHAASGCTGV